jgi:6-phosphogluconolactonase
MKNIILTILFMLPLMIFAQENYLLIGTYTSGKSEGIYVYTFNSSNGKADSVSKIHSLNPSYLAVSPDEKFVYAVYEEGNNNNIGGSIAAYGFNKANGQLTYLNQQPSGGDHPCYVAIDQSGKHLAVANYTGGSISLLPIEKDGTIGKTSRLIQQQGKSINTVRQASPHVHYTHFTGNGFQLLATDLGTDKVLLYDIDPFTFEVKPGGQPFISTRPGSGPRHMDFSSDNKFAYVIEELSGMVETYRYKNKKLKIKQRLSCLPPGFKGEAASADIHISPNGNFVYCSNRGTANSIAIFKRNNKNGKLTNIGFQSTLGLSPRNFSIDPGGNFLLVANQKSDNIVVFKIDALTGTLSDTGNRINVGNPVCLKWIKMR